MYTIYKGFLPEVDTFELQGFTEKAQCIFNPDKKRIQHKLARNTRAFKTIEDKLRARGLLRGRDLQDMFVLHSKPGCKRQRFHYDYNPEEIRTLRKKPQGVLIATEDNTFLDLENEKISLDASDMVIFDGDLMHAGSAYERSNTRLHCYLDSPSHTRQKNQTYFPVLK